MKKDWIGIDCIKDELVTASSSCVLIDKDDFKRERSCGCKVEAAIPASVLFIERISLPASVKLGNEKMLKSLLDVKLPISADDCLSVYEPLSDNEVMAFAVRRTDYESYLTKLKEICGCVPERVAPAPLVLWKRLHTEIKKDKNKKGDLILINSADNGITILHGKLSGNRKGGVLSRVVTSPSGDFSAALRALRILISRSKEIQAIYIAGAAAANELREEIEKDFPELKVSLLAAPEYFTVRALAEDGNVNGASLCGNFAKDEFVHPALVNRTYSGMILKLGVAALAVAYLLYSSFMYYAKAKEANDKVDAAVKNAAVVLAGRQISSPPKSRVELMRRAKNEFWTRVDPEIEAFTMPSLTEAIEVALKFAPVREMKFDSFILDNAGLTVSLTSESDDNVASLCGALRDRGYFVKYEKSDVIPLLYKVSVSVTEFTEE